MFPSERDILRTPRPLKRTSRNFAPLSVTRFSRWNFFASQIASVASAKQTWTRRHSIYKFYHLKKSKYSLSIIFIDYIFKYTFWYCFSAGSSELKFCDLQQNAVRDFGRRVLTFSDFFLFKTVSPLWPSTEVSSTSEMTSTDPWRAKLERSGVAENIVRNLSRKLTLNCR